MAVHGIHCQGNHCLSVLLIGEPSADAFCMLCELMLFPNVSDGVVLKVPVGH